MFKGAMGQKKGCCWGCRWGSEGWPSWKPSFRSAEPLLMLRLKVACPDPLAQTLTTSLRLLRRKASSESEKVLEEWMLGLAWDDLEWNILTSEEI